MVLAALALAACVTPAPPLSRVDFADPNVFPESITSNAAGDLIIGSAATGSIYRAARGEAVASVWIPSAATGIKQGLGVFADEASGTLFACSIGMGAPPPEADALSALFALDLRSGALKQKYLLPGGARSLCNDIAVDRAGTVYVSETQGARVLARTRDGAALVEWIADERLAGVNGIAVGADGALYVGAMATGRLFRIAVAADGAAGAITELSPSIPLLRPDGLRAIGGSRFLLAEAGGRISEIEIVGERAIVTPLGTGDGWSSAARIAGRTWAVNPKAQYLFDPNLRGQDPNPFFVEAIPPAP